VASQSTLIMLGDSTEQLRQKHTTEITE